MADGYKQFISVVVPDSDHWRAVKTNCFIILLNHKKIQVQIKTAAIISADYTHNVKEHHSNDSAAPLRYKQVLSVKQDQVYSDQCER